MVSTIKLNDEDIRSVIASLYTTEIGQVTLEPLGAVVRLNTNDITNLIGILFKMPAEDITLISGADTMSCVIEKVSPAVVPKEA